MSHIKVKSDYAGVYIASSSGGGGHKACAEALAKKHVFKERTVHTLDIMRSSACFHSVIGKMCTDMWDRAQNKGDIAEQTRIIRKQPYAEFVFFIPTFFTIVMDLLFRKKLPSKFIVTQPNMLPAILAGIRFVNRFQKKDEQIKKVDLYMTDYPKEEAVHFFNALKRVSKNYPELASMIKLHSPPPTANDLEKFGNSLDNFWRHHTGLAASQVKEGHIPIDASYLSLNLPVPNQPCALEVKAQTAKEASFLGVPHNTTKTFEITADDKVGLVMLGSQPTHAAIRGYVQGMLTAASKVQAQHKTTFFVACGPKDKPTLYNEMATLVEQNRDLLNEANVEIVPFTGQPVKTYRGRADLSITRSGGITTAEHLAMYDREEGTGKILIHTQTPIDFTQKVEEALRSGLSQHDAEQLVRNSYGNPLWEGGNALYLQEACGKDVVSFVGVEEAEKIFTDFLRGH